MTITEAPIGQSVTNPVTPAPNRSYWVDNLRTLTILFVVNMHACVTYSHVGSWYYNAAPEPTIPAKIPFLFWQAHLQAFFMGLMFFVVGYYADRSLARRGSVSFVKERLRRLGIPTLIYMLALHPLIVIGLHPGYDRPDHPLAYYGHYLVSGRFVGESGPMWFAFAALIFSLVFAGANRRVRSSIPSPLVLRAWQVLLLGAMLGVCSFLVRTVQPIGASVLNFQFCYFSQYIVVFGLGIWVSRKDGLASLAGSTVAKLVGITACFLGPLALGVVASRNLPSHNGTAPALFGGWNWSAFEYAMWEQMAGVALGIGFMALCYRKLNVETQWSKWMSDRSFGVYWLHPPILVGLALLFQAHRVDPYTMSILLTVAGIVVSFAAADLAKRVPGLKSLL